MICDELLFNVLNVWNGWFADKELRDVGQAHLIPQVDVEVARVREEGGKVCQVCAYTIHVRN